METSQGVCREHFDLETKFYETDYTIPQQVNKAFKYGEKIITVISADTDVFVLLCNMYAVKVCWDAEVYI